MSKAASPPDPQALLDDLISRNLTAGADAADGVMFESARLSVSQRLGVSEGIERAESQDIGLPPAPSPAWVPRSASTPPTNGRPRPNETGAA